MPDFGPTDPGRAADRPDAPRSAAAGGADWSYFAVLVGATFLMGSSFIAGKILLEHGYPPFPLVGWRFVLAALATLPIVALFVDRPGRALLPRLAPRGWATVALIGLLQTGGVMGLLFVAMQTLSAPTAAILLFTNPIWVAALARVTGAERLGPSQLAGLLLGSAGVALAIGVGNPGDTVGGALIGLGSALCWAMATLVNQRARLPVDPWALTFWQMLIGAAALLALAWAMGERWPAGTTPAEWGWFLWLAIPASTGSFGLWFVALRRGGATRTSSFLFLAPLFAVVLSAILLDAPLSWPQLAGGALVGTGLWLVNRSRPGGKLAESPPPDRAGRRWPASIVP